MFNYFTTISFKRFRFNIFRDNIISQTSIKIKLRLIQLPIFIFLKYSYSKFLIRFFAHPFVD